MADRLIPLVGSGALFAAGIQEEITALWDRSNNLLTAIGGTGDGITATLAPALTSGLVAGMSFRFVAGANNTGAVTIAINGAATIAIKDADGAPLTAGKLVSGRLYQVDAYGTDLRLVGSATAGKNYVKWIYLASATWTRPVGLISVIATVLAGGGGGGGCANTGTTGPAGPGAGGGAAIVTKLFAALASTVAVTVGAGGAGATSGANNGSAGGSSSFGAHAVATGGGGGIAHSTGPQQRGSAAPGIGTTGDIKLRGNEWPAFESGSTLSASFPGGASAMGNGGPRGVSSGNAGVAAEANSGAGGSGANSNFNGARAGGAGGSGYVIVEEFY